MVEHVNRQIESLLQARLHDPFGLLGLHHEGAEWVVRVYEPDATGVDLLNNDGAVALKRGHPAGVAFGDLAELDHGMAGRGD